MTTGFDDSRLDRIGAVGRRYVDDGLFPCSAVQVAHRGEVVYNDVYGSAHVEADQPATLDTVFRIYSMTKPLVSLVLMQLYEEGRFLLEDPVGEYVPALANLSVWDGGTDQAPRTRPAKRQPSVKDMLTHTSGLSYGFMRQHPVDALYRAQSLGDFSPTPFDLDEVMRRLGELPLLFDPGEGWNYSMSTDVCGAIIESITGQSLDQALAERLLDPLGMTETGFQVTDDQKDRFTALYARVGDNPMARIDDPATSGYCSPPAFLSGGGGLVSTIGDYQKFCDMLLAGGVGGGFRAIGRKTLEFMASNHLPEGRMLNEMGQSSFLETTMEGMGFGLGFSVLMDSALNGCVSSIGEFAWGGAASTAFWIDPLEELTVIFMTQFLPSSAYPIRRELRAAVYQALT